MRERIFRVVELFYQSATSDVLIGYHFEKFNDESVLGPHLERITSFWEMQLTGTTSRPFDKSFHLLFTHLQLNIRQGELGRWIQLFHKTIDSQNLDPEMSQLWKEKIAFFEMRFKSHPQMFNRN